MQHNFYRTEPSQAEIEWRMAGCPEPYTCDMTDEEWREEQARLDAEIAAGIHADERNAWLALEDHRERTR